jgi:hypothetical protein
MQENLVVERNLQSRLDAAREERRRAAEPGDAAPAVDPPVGPDDPRVIDLRTLRSVRQAGRQARTAPRPDAAGPDPAGEVPNIWDGSPRASMTLLLQRRAALRGEAIPTTSPAQQSCPNCGGSVRIDVYDLVASVAHLTCLDCGLLFTARSPHA